MTPLLEKMKTEALTLPQKDRARLAGILIDSLDEGADADADSAWLEEIRRRDALLRSGKARLKPADRVLQEARRRLQCNR